MPSLFSLYQRLLATVVVCLTPTAFAETDWASIVWQNDIFAGIDGGGYTNGLFISLYDLSWEGETEYKPPLLTRPLLWMLNGDKSRAFSERTLGQAMVTPEDITKDVPDPNDAPYAGLLMYRNSHIVIRDNFADNVSTTIGIVGPSSMAKQAQTFIHKVTGSDRPMGWDYQLKDEPVFMLSRTSIWRHPLAGNWFDAITIVHATGGNLESAVGVGGIVRVGQNLNQSFASAALHFGSSSAPTAINGGWYLYTGFEADYVFNNIFIDGNTYRKSQSSDLKHEQFILTSGVTYAWESFSVALAFKTGTALDKQKTDRDNYGTVTLAWRM